MKKSKSVNLITKLNDCNWQNIFYVCQGICTCKGKFVGAYNPTEDNYGLATCDLCDTVFKYIGTSYDDHVDFQIDTVEGSGEVASVDFSVVDHR